ncbi:MAG: hypothetical protein Q8L49_16245 [Burkholderiaceae bacterium]|nr:hypothetical protein [Burkholderiaceae bacterium]
MTTKPLFPALTMSVVLVACGGSPLSSDEVPPGATDSPAAYSQYVGSLAASDSAEPLDIDNAVPPTSETDAPIDVV